MSAIVDSLLAPLNEPSTVSLDSAEHLLTTEKRVPFIIEKLEEHGYEKVSWHHDRLATHWDTGEFCLFSYRKIDPGKPTYQWHVVGFMVDIGCVELAGHYERRPDRLPIKRPEGRESVRDVVRRLEDHYDHTDERTYEPGVADLPPALEVDHYQTPDIHD